MQVTFFDMYSKSSVYDGLYLRCFKVTNALLQRVTKCYKEILDEKKMLSVQFNMEQYFKKVERPEPLTSAASITTEPLPSTSAASTTPTSPPSY